MHICLLSNAGELARVPGDWSKTALFDMPDGCVVTHIALYDGETPIEVIELPKPVNCPKGVVPVVRNKQLIIAKSVAGNCDDTVAVDLETFFS